VRLRRDAGPASAGAANQPCLHPSGWDFELKLKVKRPVGIYPGHTSSAARLRCDSEIELRAIVAHSPSGEAESPGMRLYDASSLPLRKKRLLPWHCRRTDHLSRRDSSRQATDRSRTPRRPAGRDEWWVLCGLIGLTARLSRSGKQRQHCTLGYTREYASFSIGSIKTRLRFDYICGRDIGRKLSVTLFERVLLER
jgi:hypothetical protein